MSFVADNLTSATVTQGRGGGTVRWQAPELLDIETVKPRNTQESDVYALACVWYEVMSALSVGDSLS